jgi:hypothetical protein
MGSGWDRFGVLGAGKRGGRMVLGLQGRETGSCIFLCLQVCFRPGNGRLRRIVFRRAAGSCPRRGGGHDSLPRVAHFLDRGTHSAAEQTDDTNQYNNEP